MIGIRLCKMLQEHLKTGAIHTWQVNTETLACCGINRSIQIGPLVGALHYVGWAKPFGTVALLIPVDQTEACLARKRTPTGREGHPRAAPGTGDEAGGFAPRLRYVRWPVARTARRGRPLRGRDAGRPQSWYARTVAR